MKHSFSHDYWDRVWQGDAATAMAGGQTNPHLIREVGDLRPGTALDAGCGAGMEALWLAERGWTVTGVDITEAALAVAAERAAASGLANRTTWMRADLTAWQPDRTFDLVTTHYAHPQMPQLDFYDRIASWVAPGGTLVIVGHLHDAADTHRHASSEAHHQGGPPAEASANAATAAARLDPRDWEICTADELRRSVSRSGDDRQVSLSDFVVRAVRRQPTGADER